MVTDATPRTSCRRMTGHHQLLPLPLLLTAALLCLVPAAQGQYRSPRITEHPSDTTVPRNRALTLNCRAEGRPKPEILWFKDGQQINVDSRQRVTLIEGGSLFFLAVQQSRKESDAGVYWCEARNPAGQARSHNATLKVAVLRDVFKTIPEDTIVARGDRAVLHCAPPKGDPPPTIRWKLNGKIVDVSTTDRLKIGGEGDLIIDGATAEDAGKYTCEAHNYAGMHRETQPALLSVHVRPHLVRSPVDTTVLVGESVDLACQVAGDPQPSVYWSRLNDRMPTGRINVLADKTLRIEQIRTQDEGTYVCEADNVVGSVTASATVTVHSQPSFDRAPNDRRAARGETVTFECGATGHPTPTVYWTTAASGDALFAGDTKDRFSVGADGSLRVEAAHRADRGYYSCTALNAVGSEVARAHLEVTERGDVRPPPVLTVMPGNQTLPLKSPALLPCRAADGQQSVISWDKNGRPISEDNPRRQITARGDLKLVDLLTSDSGLYTCTVTSSTGQTSASALLTVANPKNTNVILHRVSGSDTYPSPPQRPRVAERDESSVSLSWRTGQQMGGSPLRGYTVEYYSPDSLDGWVVAVRRVAAEAVTVTGLRPDTTYVFGVRAENGQGSSPLSELSVPVHTLAAADDGVEGRRMAEAARRLQEFTVELRKATPISSTAVRLSWKLLTNSRFIEGFLIRYRNLDTGRYEVLDIHNSGREYVVANLDKFTRYQFFLVPVFQSVLGRPSNIEEVRTMEDAPSGPPLGLEVSPLNATAARVSWRPPALKHRNGVTTGYLLHLRQQDSSFRFNVTVNATTTQVILKNLTAGAEFLIRTAAVNRGGTGPLSPAVAFAMSQGRGGGGSGGGVGAAPDPRLAIPVKSVVSEVWFIALIGTLIFLVLSTFVGVIYWRRRKEKKALGNLTVTSGKPDDISLLPMQGERGQLWMDASFEPGGWHSQIQKGPETKLLNCDVPPMVSSEYAELDQRNVSTFYGAPQAGQRGVQEDPAPYATTMLLSGAGRHPLPPGSGSDESAPRRSGSSDHSAPTKRSGSDFGSGAPGSSGSGGSQHRGSRTPGLESYPGMLPPLDFNEFAPPPPQFPPPDLTSGARGAHFAHHPQSGSAASVRGLGSPRSQRRHAASSGTGSSRSARSACGRQPLYNVSGEQRGEMRAEPSCGEDDYEYEAAPLVNRGGVSRERGRERRQRPARGSEPRLQLQERPGAPQLQLYGAPEESELSERGSPESSVNGEAGGSWEPTSCDEESDGSDTEGGYNEAVIRAAQQAGITVTGGRAGRRRHSPHHHYSTDSTYAGGQGRPSRHHRKRTHPAAHTLDRAQPPGPAPDSYHLNDFSQRNYRLADGRAAEESGPLLVNSAT